MLTGREGVRWEGRQGIRRKRSTWDVCAESRGYLSLCSLSLFILEGVSLVIPFEEVWSVNVLEWFPGVVAFRIPFPFHEVLERSRFPMMSVVDQVFNLVFFGPLDQVRR